MPIKINNLSYTYSKGTTFEKKALKNINLTVENGEFVGIIGHTGSGKSTLMMHLNSLLKPESGSVVIDGFDINSDKSRLKEIRARVGLVFQYPEHQLFEMTVFKDVAFGPGNMGLSEDEINERVRWALSLVGIPESMFEKSPFDLSGGQKRRAAIAGVLAMKPEILVLDEPAAGLDPRARDEILEKIKEMHDTLKITVILVSHSMEDVARLVDRIIVINQGEIAFDDIPGAVFKNLPELEKMGLSSPQAARLIYALKEKGFDLPEGIYTVNSAVAALSELIKGLERNKTGE